MVGIFFFSFWSRNEYTYCFLLLLGSFWRHFGVIQVTFGGPGATFAASEVLNASEPQTNRPRVVHLYFFGRFWRPTGSPKAPKSCPGRPKRVQKTSRSGFVDTSKTMVFMWFLMVFRGLRAPGSSKSDPEAPKVDQKGDLRL